MPRCFLGLGGNIGNVAATFASAIDQLGCGEFPIRTVRTSSIYRTAPIGADAGCDFLNAVAEVDTELSPSELLEQLQAVEQSFGRTRKVHWGPRPLDIDLLLYGNQIIEQSDLIVPHPAMWYRRFVLDPLAEIAAKVVHPTRRVTIGQIRQRLLIRPFQLKLFCADAAQRNRLLAALRSRFSNVQFHSAPAELPSGRTRTATLAWLNPLEISSSRGPKGGGDLNSVPVTVPADADGGLSFLSSVIASATDQPVVVDGPILT